MTTHSEEITVTMTPTLARQIIEAVGGEQAASGQWIFPDGSWYWLLSEAVSYALEAMPTVVFDAL